MRMAYLVVYHKDQEIDRRKLEGAVTIGRSPDCELSVHDILLSRRHCQIEPEGDDWLITDLGSKNGTRVGGKPVFRLKLTDCDVIRMGKTAIRFRAGEFVPRPKPVVSPNSGIQRPADPFEALAGTVRDFAFDATTVAPNGIAFPQPKPSPPEPEAYQDEDVRSLVSQLVSSSWDSIYETARHSEIRVPAGPMVEAVRRKRALEPRVDVALQVIIEPEAEAEAEEILPLPPLTEPTKQVSQTTIRMRRISPVMHRLTKIFQWLPLAMLIWVR